VKRKDAAFGFLFGAVGGAVIGVLYGQGVRQRATGAVKTSFRNGKLQIEVDTIEAATPALLNRFLP